MNIPPELTSLVGGAIVAKLFWCLKLIWSIERRLYRIEIKLGVNDDPPTEIPK